MAEIKDTRKERKNNAESIQLKEQLGEAKQELMELLGKNVALKLKIQEREAKVQGLIEQGKSSEEKKSSIENQI